MAGILQGFAAILWPSLIVAFAFFYGNELKDLLKNRTLRLIIAGQEITLEESSEQQTRLMADLQRRVHALERSLEHQARPGQQETRASEKAGSETRTILWVDDRPRNNAALQSQMNTLGFGVINCVSTAEAMSVFGFHRFDAVITDMGRAESQGYNATAGLELTKAIRALDDTVPIVVYTSAAAVRKYRDQALAARATTVTTSPGELLNVLLDQTK